MIRIGRRHTGTVRRAAACPDPGLNRLTRWAAVTGLTGALLPLTGCAAVTIHFTWIGPGVTSATAALVPSAG